MAKVEGADKGAARDLPPDVKMISKKEDVALEDQLQYVLEMDSHNNKLCFDSTPGRFLELPDSVMRELSEMNQLSFLKAKISHQQELEEAEFLPSGEMDIKPEVIMASNLLDVKVNMPGVHTCWLKPWQLQNMQKEGYFPIPAEKVNGHSALKRKSYVTIGNKGNTELILAGVSEKVYENRQKEISNRSMIQNEGVLPDTEQKIINRGGTPIRVKEKE